PLFLATLIKYRVWDNNFQPWIATELPSIERGTWKVLPDGRMETTWHLRRDVKWHDGQTMTAGDLVLGWQVVTDPKFATLEAGIPKMMESVQAPDDYTLVISWKEIYPYANLLTRSGLTPMPRHLLEADYRRDPAAFSNHPYFTSNYVGTGPYRVTSFDPGQGIRFDAFPDYFLGRPKIDTVIYRIMGDQNSALAAVLANEIDVTMRTTIGLEPSLKAKENWEASGQGTVYHVPTGWNAVNLSYRNPWFEDVRLRRGMLQAIDREEIVRTLLHGLTKVPDTLVRPSDPLYPEVDRQVAKYPFDPNRARQLLSDAGWRPSADGILVNGRGERLSFEARGVAGDRENEAVQAAVLDYWHTIGAETTVNNLPRRVMDEPMNRAVWPGACFCGSAGGSLEPNDPKYTDWHSKFIPTEENGWQGDNQEGWRGGDSILDQWVRELDLGKSEQLRHQLALRWAEDLPNLPLYFSVEITTVRKNVLNASPRLGSGGSNAMTWNIQEWDKAS
ncbi:MAG: peptide/nickel transport system substrate-binding protein, partial [Chloroflexota bacterium]|nr:peptide/nickel transport system substrate-binding protein [Chloroflexota bacterium]